MGRSGRTHHGIFGTLSQLQKPPQTGFPGLCLVGNVFEAFDFAGLCARGDRDAGASCKADWIVMGLQPFEDRRLKTVNICGREAPGN